jgi:hypothetical protein
MNARKRQAEAVSPLFLLNKYLRLLELKLIRSELLFTRLFRFPFSSVLFGVVFRLCNKEQRKQR